jgi:hypothetical protein
MESRNGKNVIELPGTYAGFALAREVLRNTDHYDLDAIDAAFEVLIYSGHKEDQLLCEAAVDAMWAVPKPSAPVFLVVAAFMAVALVSLVAILTELIK